MLRRVLVAVGLALVLLVWADAASFADGSGGTMTVGAINTDANTCWGGAGYVEWRTVTATSTGTVSPPLFSISHPGFEPGDLEADVWVEGTEQPIDGSGTSACGQVAVIFPGHRDQFAVSAGTTYRIALAVYENNTDYAGDVADYGDLLDQIADATPSGGGGDLPAAGGHGVGIWLDRTTGRVHLDEDAWVGLGAAAFIASVVAGLATARLVLP